MDDKQLGVLDVSVAASLAVLLRSSNGHKKGTMDKDNLMRFSHAAYVS